MNFLLKLMLIILFTASTQTPVEAQQLNNYQITYRIFKNEVTSFGYDIYINNKKSIHQPTIPCISNRIGFASKKDAEKVAKYLINKLKNNPNQRPSLTIQELTSLKII